MYPGLTDDDHSDIVMEAITRVLGRLRSGPLEDERTYLMRVVFTTGARHLARPQGVGVA